MDKTIFDQLTEEHEKIKSLIQRARSCSMNDRPILIKNLEEELIPHARAEEVTLYAVLLECAKEEGDPDGIEITNESYAEHKEIDEILNKMKVCDPEDDRWEALLNVMQEEIEHHLREEESLLFKSAQSILTEEEQEDIFEYYLKAKEKFKKALPMQRQIPERRPMQELR